MVEISDFGIERGIISVFCMSVLCAQELDLLEEDANVYKLIGPVLVKQDLAEANANVHKRIEYISAELWVSFYYPFLNIGLVVDSSRLIVNAVDK